MISSQQQVQLIVSESVSVILARKRQRQTSRERIMERNSTGGTQLEILSSFDFNTTSSIMQSGKTSRQINQTEEES